MPSSDAWNTKTDDAIAVTERLILRPHRAEDAESLYVRIESDPEVTRFTGGSHALDETRRDLAELIASMVNDPRGLGSWAVVERATDTYIGYTLLKPFRIDDVELGYAIARTWWGQGYGTEAARATLLYGLGTLGLPSVIAAVNPANKASARIAEKIGMVHKGLIPWPDQGDVDLYEAVAS
jgi:RimJ/RimL family protein N-acetyltransferase